MTAPNKITKGALQDCADRGLSQAKTAIALGVSDVAITKAKRRFGVEFKPVHIKPDDYILAMKDGLTQEETAARLGIKHSAVKNASIRLGLTFKRKRTRDMATIIVPDDIPEHLHNDFRILIAKGRYNAETAKKLVTKPKVKIRAPRMDELA